MIDDLPQLEDYFSKEKNYELLMSYCHNLDGISEEGIRTISNAYEYCFSSHITKKRKSGEPYYTHPLLATLYFINIFRLPDVSAIAACLLHDTVEDSDDRDMMLDEIRKQFGTDIAFLVDCMTNIRGTPTDEAASFAKLLVGIIRDYRIIYIKLCDRLHNMLTLEGHTKAEKKREIAQETLDFFVPIAQYLGIWELKNDLEEKAFYFIDNESYQKIKNELMIRRRTFSSKIESIESNIRDVLDYYKVNYVITIAHKTNFQIYQLMQKQNLPASQIDDFFSVVISLQSNEVPECYHVLGMLYEHFQPIDFRDYISKPKFNEFKSLITYLYGQDGRKIEILIRTQEMDDIATYGILSKLRLNKSYKSLDLKDSELNILEDWIQDKIMELDKDTTALIWDMLQDNFYREEINVHCMGMTIRLPKGATIVDLAFKVDPENAIYLTDATIDHKKVPYFYKLLDRNVVDLEFGDVQTVKSDWLNNVVLFKSIIQIYKYVKK